MFFVIVGVLIIALNLLGIGPIGDWNWDFTGDVWKFTVPFILAALWWTWADKSGLNKRREIEKMEAKKRARREDNLEAMGLDRRARRKVNKR
jgi:small Trp-rich protein